MSLKPNKAKKVLKQLGKGDDIELLTANGSNLPLLQEITTEIKTNLDQLYFDNGEEIITILMKAIDLNQSKKVAEAIESNSYSTPCFNTWDREMAAATSIYFGCLLVTGGSGVLSCTIAYAGASFFIEQEYQQCIKDTYKN